MIADDKGVEGISQTEATILYVDDQPSHRLLFERSFRGNWLVLTAASAEEALTVLKEHDIFLVISDHNMPEVTGVDFLIQAKAASPQSVRAILSAYGSDQLRQEARQRAGVEAFFEKPWDRKKIRAFIEESFLRHLHGAVESEPKPDTASVLNEAAVLADRLSERLIPLQEVRCDDRAVKRIFSVFVEPKLKNFVPIIRRPTTPALAEAVKAAISGQTRELDRALGSYLREANELTEAPLDPSQ